MNLGVEISVILILPMQHMEKFGILQYQPVPVPSWHTHGPHHHYYHHHRHHVLFIFQTRQHLAGAPLPLIQVQAEV